MILTSFRVRMFKSVIDSGDVRVSPLSVIVGKNEAGKTSLLKALHLLNPAIPETYRLAEEWPRGHRNSRSPGHSPCVATFTLSDEAEAALAQAGIPTDGTRVLRVGRTYANTLEVIDQPPLAPVAQAALAGLLPKFVFMDEYATFKGSARLDQVHQRGSQNALLPDDKALLTIMTLAGLKLEEQVSAGNQPDRTQRQFDLADASATITRRMASHWKGGAYEVQFGADGHQFWTFVKAPGEKALIRLEERSRGFQWFFSFDAKLMHETKGDLRNCVLLLDEPGLHLHASAQQALLARLEEYAQGNTMIYTTHLPFMINLQEPDRIRALDVTGSGPVVTENLFESSPEAKLTLQAALGMVGRYGMPIGDLNLTVEGVHDYWFLTAFSHLFEREGKPCLPEDLIITACAGAPEVTYLSTFMVGQELRVVALYDGDGEGRSARDKFTKNWLNRYKKARAEALTLDSVIPDCGDVAIEDLFPEKFYVDAVKALYRRHLPEGEEGEIVLTAGGTLANRVERALAAHRIQFNKGSVAKALCTKIRAMKSTTELPPETFKRVSDLFVTLQKAIALTSR